MAKQFDYKKAIDAGYSPLDISDYIEKNPDLQVVNLAANEANSPQLTPSPTAISQATNSLKSPSGPTFDYKGALAAGYMPSEIDTYIKGNPGVSIGDNLGNFGTANDWNSFVEQAKVLAKANDFPLAVLLGQAELESGRGESGLTTGYNNFFGIKGNGSLGAVTMPTQEFGNGGYYNTDSQFAAYKSPADSIQSYINLIKNSYGVNTTANSDPVQVLKDIQSHGYATSPTYINNVMNTDSFKQFQ